MAKVRRMAVIGAGSAGLVSIKICLEEGFEPVCYEKTSHIAGLWHFSDEPRTNPRGPATIYKDMHTNVAKTMMAFSDFPFPKTLAPYIKGREVCKYLESYAEHFNLMNHIHFNTEVVDVQKVKDFSKTGRWRVTIRQESGTEKVEIFDAVLVCAGLFSAGHMPEYPGLDEFGGEILHSCQFKEGADFKDKVVLVVGSAISAGDIASVISNHTRRVYLSLRHGAYIIPKNLDGNSTVQPITIRANNLFPGQRFFLFKRTRAKIDALSNFTNLGVQSTKSFRMQNILNDHLPSQIMNGDVKIRSGVRKFERSKVIFVDGLEVSNLDCVIFATGYDVKFPFLRNEDFIGDSYSEMKLFQSIFPPRMEHPTLAFIGYMLALCGQNSLCETQARYVTKVFKKEVRLPTTEEMEKEISTRMDILWKFSGRHTPLVFNDTVYKDNLAKAIGALPSLKKMIFTDPKLAYHYLFGVAYPGAREDFLQSKENEYYGITVKNVRGDAVEKLRELKKSEAGFLSGYLIIAILAIIVYFLVL